MEQAMERFVRFAGTRLIWINVIALVAIKILLPYGSGGMASITNILRPIDTGEVIALTNDARQALSVAPLKHNTILDAAAQAKLADMAANGYFAHVSPQGTPPWDFISHAGYRYQSAGENLAKGFADPAAVVQAWMQSPGHRANIVNPAYRDIGVAAGQITLNGRSSMVIVQLFGAPRVAAARRTTSRLPLQPVSVAIPSGATSATIARALSSAYSLYLSLLIGLLGLAALPVLGMRRTVSILAAHGALLAIAVAIPAATAAQLLIF